MELTLAVGYVIELCMQLVTVICLRIYYRLFYDHSDKQAQCLTHPQLTKFFVIPNRVNKFVDIRCCTNCEAFWCGDIWTCVFTAQIARQFGVEIS
jgi:hypothetical protein